MGKRCIVLVDIHSVHNELGCFMTFVIPCFIAHCCHYIAIMIADGFFCFPLVFVSLSVWFCAIIRLYRVRH